MSNSLFKSTLIAGVLFSSTDSSWAECPNTHIECVNGTKQKVNTKWSWHTAKCEPMKSGGGNSLDVAIKACEENGGGIKEGSIKDGISVKLIAERAAKIGFIVGKAVFEVVTEQQKSKQSQPAGASSATSLGSSIISKVPGVIRDIGSSKPNTPSSSSPSSSSSSSPNPVPTNETVNLQPNTSTPSSTSSYSSSSPNPVPTNETGNVQPNTSTPSSPSSSSSSLPNPVPTNENGNTQLNTTSSSASNPQVSPNRPTQINRVSRFRSRPKPSSSTSNPPITSNSSSSESVTESNESEDTSQNTTTSSSALNPQVFSNDPTPIRRERRARSRQNPSSSTSNPPITSNSSTSSTSESAAESAA